MQTRAKQSSTPSPQSTTIDPWAPWITAAVSVGMAFWRYEQLLIGAPPPTRRPGRPEPTAATAPRLTLVHSNAVVVVRSRAVQRPSLRPVPTPLHLRGDND